MTDKDLILGIKLAKFVFFEQHGTMLYNVVVPFRKSGSENTNSLPGKRFKMGLNQSSSQNKEYKQIMKKFSFKELKCNTDDIPLVIKHSSLEQPVDCYVDPLVVKVEVPVVTQKEEFHSPLGLYHDVRVKKINNGWLVCGKLEELVTVILPQKFIIVQPNIEKRSDRVVVKFERVTDVFM